MIAPGAGVRVYLAYGVTDMKKGIGAGRARPAGAEAEPGLGRGVLLPGASRRPAEAAFLGRPGVLPLLQGAGEGALPVALAVGRDGVGLSGIPCAGGRLNIRPSPW